MSQGLGSLVDNAAGFQGEGPAANDRVTGLEGLVMSLEQELREERRSREASGPLTAGRGTTSGELAGAGNTYNTVQGARFSSGPTNGQYYTSGQEGPGTAARSYLGEGAEASRESATREYASSHFNSFDVTGGREFRVKANYAKFDGNGDRYRSFRADLLSYASYHRFEEGYFRDPPIHVEPIDWARMAYEGVSRLEIQQAEHAWQYLLSMITHEPTKQMVRRTRSPTVALAELDRWFILRTSGHEMNLLE